MLINRLSETEKGVASAFALALFPKPKYVEVREPHQFLFPPPGSQRYQAILTTRRFCQSLQKRAYCLIVIMRSNVKYRIDALETEDLDRVRENIDKIDRAYDSINRKKDTKRPIKYEEQLVEKAHDDIIACCSEVLARAAPQEKHIDKVTLTPARRKVIRELYIFLSDCEERGEGDGDVDPDLLEDKVKEFTKSFKTDAIDSEEMIEGKALLDAKSMQAVSYGKGKSNQY